MAILRRLQNILFFKNKIPVKRNLKTFVPGVSVQATCICKKTKVWIEEGRITSPCPNCGRILTGVYSRRKLTIVPKVVGRSDVSKSIPK